jgi:hypothetical protein
MHSVASLGRVERGEDLMAWSPRNFFRVTIPFFSPRTSTVLPFPSAALLRLGLQMLASLTRSSFAYKAA